MIVLLDCDGVLCNFLGGLLAAVNEARGTVYDQRDCGQWDIAKAYGLTWTDLNLFCTAPAFCAQLDTMHGALDAVRRLRAMADVYCVTSPLDASSYWMWERSEWLRVHLGFDSNHVIHASTKRLIQGDVLIDDKPETIVEWANAWPLQTALLFDAPYNQCATLPANARRVHGWNEAMAAIEGKR